MDSHFKPTLGGYPGDKPRGTQWASQKEAFLNVNDHTLFTDMDLAPGESGSAVWRYSDGMIVGVLVRQFPNWNEANRIDSQFLTTLIAGCASMRCEFEHYVEPSPPAPPPAPSPPPSPGPSSTVPNPTPSQIGVDAFMRTWSRTDRPVDQGAVSRTWMWGPQGYTPVFTEPYVQSPNGQRTVQYFDKSRMEITNPDGDPNSIWYVTNGLLVNELMTGKLQLGDNQFEQRAPADLNVAGDPNDTGGPTYAALARVMTNQPVPTGWTITQTIDRSGTVGNRDGLASYNVTAATLVPDTHHTVASVFWDFMNSSGMVDQGGDTVKDQLFQNPFYATGFPITEPYWAHVTVGGVEKDVLIQCFQRRCLTYTPSNPSGWKVEAGNVGQHYFRWRYQK